MLEQALWLLCREYKWSEEASSEATTNTQARHVLGQSGGERSDLEFVDVRANRILRRIGCEV